MTKLGVLVENLNNKLSLLQEKDPKDLKRALVSVTREHDRGFLTGEKAYEKILDILQDFIGVLEDINV
jgi:hypothetical protein